MRIQAGVALEGTTADTIGAFIYYGNAWEPHLTRWLQERLKPGDVFVDVGAHVGYFSLTAARIVGPEGGVVAVEPAPANFTALRANIERNGAGNVRAVKAAASDHRARVAFWTDPLNAGAATLVESSDLSYRLSGSVDAAPLADLLTADEARQARVIKLDVEGSEAAAVVGMEPLLASARADLEVVVEVHPDRLERTGADVSSIFEVFDRAGFDARRLKAEGDELIAHTDITSKEQIVFARRAS